MIVESCILAVHITVWAHIKLGHAQINKEMQEMRKSGGELKSAKALPIMPGIMIVLLMGNTV